MGKLYDLLNTLIGKVNNSVKVEAQTLTDAQKEQARKNIGAAAEGAGGVQSDWNQMDETAADFIKNKPFGDVYGDTLSWDGDIKDLPNVAGAFFKVSDATPTYADIAKGGYMILAGSLFPFTAEDLPESDVVQPDGIITVGYYAAIVPPEMAGVESEYVGATFPEAGVYFSTQITELQLNGYTGFQNVVKMDAKYMPAISSVNMNGLTKLYVLEGSGLNTAGYLYVDSQCTQKATISDVPDSIWFSIGVANSFRVVMAWVSPSRVNSGFASTDLGYKYVEITLGTDTYMYYTSEYTP